MPPPLVSPAAPPPSASASPTAVVWPAPRRRHVLPSVAPCPSANRRVRLSPCSAVWSSPCQPSRLAASRRRVACALTSSRLALRRALPIRQPSRLVVALQRLALQRRLVIALPAVAPCCQPSPCPAADQASGRRPACA